jgi:hypothetical protein
MPPQKTAFLSMCLRATKEAEIRRILVRSESWQIVHETLSQKIYHKKGVVWWVVQVVEHLPSNWKPQVQALVLPKKKPPKTTFFAHPWSAPHLSRLIRRWQRSLVAAVRPLLVLLLFPHICGDFLLSALESAVSVAVNLFQTPVNESDFVCLR